LVKEQKATKTVSSTKRPAANITNIRKGRDKAARRFSPAFSQDISGTGR
jgi:hypothetical protein